MMPSTKDRLGRILRLGLKTAKYVAIGLGGLWVVLVILLQVVLTESFLRKAAEKYLPEFVDGAEVTFAHVRASALRSFPNLRVEIDSLCIVYPHERWEKFDAHPGMQNPLALHGRGEVNDTLASFSSIRMAVSYMSLLKGTVSLSDVSLSDSRLFVRQYDSTETNLNVFRFMRTPPDTVATDGGQADVVFHHVGLKGRTLAVYANIADTIFASMYSRNVDISGKLALAEPFGAKLNVAVDSTLISGRTATDTIAARLRSLRLEWKRGYHNLSIDGRSFVAAGGSGRMMLPIRIDGRFRFPEKKPDRLNVRDMRLRIASLHVQAESDIEFYDDSMRVKAEVLVDTCRVQSLLGDFAPLIGSEATRVRTDARVNMTLSCDGAMSFSPLRLPPLKAALKIPESYVYHDGIPQSGQVAADIGVVSSGDGIATAVVDKLILHFAGVDMDGAGAVQDLLGPDPLVQVDASAAVDLSKLSAFLPDGMTAEGKMESRLKGSARVSELGPGRFAGADLEGFIVSDSLKFADSTLIAYIGKTDVQLTKKPKRGSAGGGIMLIVEGQVDSVYAALGETTKLRGKSLDIAISDADASVNAMRLSMVGEDSLFVALRNSRNYVRISRSQKVPDEPVGSISVSSDNESVFLRSSGQLLGLRSVQFTTNGSKTNIGDARGRRRRDKVLDSLQRIWPGTPRDSLFRKMMRRRSGGYYGGELPDYMRDRSFLAHDISFRLDESVAKYFREWSLDGYLSIERGFAYTPAFPMRTRISTLQGRFNNNEIVVDSVGIRSGRSDVSASARASGLRRALLGHGTVRLDVNLYSKYLNANEILAVIDAGQNLPDQDSVSAAGIEDESSENDIAESAVSDSLAGVPLLVIPANINLSIGVHGDTIKYSNLLVDSFRSQILMKERCLQVSGTTATSNMGRISLEGFYSTRSRNDVSVGFDLILNDITGEKVITLIPQVDTLLPLLKSFKGMLDCEFAATSELDSNMNFIKPSISGLMQINGRNLTVEQDKSIRKITRLLLFKNKKTGEIDEMSVRGLIKDNRLEIFPFDIKVDRYKLALGGTHSLDGDFKYHVSVLKSPIPWKFGINISGNSDDWKWRLGGAKYKKVDTPVYSGQLDTARINLLSSIRNIFDKGVALALEENRSQLSEIRKHLSDSTFTEDTLSASEMLRIDSLMSVNDSLEVSDSLIQIHGGADEKELTSVLQDSEKSNIFAFLSDTDCSSFPWLHSATGTCYCLPEGYAGVLKLVDKPDLGSGAERRMGSSPFTRTSIRFLPKIFSRSKVAYEPKSITASCSAS